MMGFNFKILGLTPALLEFKINNLILLFKINIIYYY